jgi:type III secretory pathway component EscR
MIVKNIFLLLSLTIALEVRADINNEVQNSRVELEKSNMQQKLNEFRNSHKELFENTTFNSMDAARNFLKASKKMQEDEQKALDVALAKIRSLEYAKVQNFIKAHKLYFVYAGFCHNCHAFSPVVSNFINRFKLDFQALSFDGGVLDEFPDYIKDDEKLKKV